MPAELHPPGTFHVPYQPGQFNNCCNLLASTQFLGCVASGVIQTAASTPMKSQHIFVNKLP